MTTPTEALREAADALEPFAAEAEWYNPIPGLIVYDDTLELWQTTRPRTKVSVGNLRAARSALTTARAVLASPSPDSAARVEVEDALRALVEYEDAAIAGTPHKVSPDGPLRADFRAARHALSQIAQGAGEERPIPMILHCPACGLQHIDAPDPDATHWVDGSRSIPWTNPPHRSHLCQGCGLIWRPADVATDGVTTITTRGQSDGPAERIATQPSTPPSAPLLEAAKRVLETCGGQFGIGSLDAALTALRAAITAHEAG